MSEGFPSIVLGTVANITMGQSPSAETYNSEENGLPFLQGCAEFGALHPQPEIYCEPPLRVAKKDSILISVRAPVGTMNLADQDYCIGRGLGAVQGISGKTNTSFLRYAIAQNVGFLHRRSQGSTFLAINSAELRLLPIPDIGFTTQGRIAEVLSTLDKAIEKTEALIAKYQQIKAGLMHDLFTRGVTADGKLRPPRAQAPELYQETPIGWIPKEWEVGELRRWLSYLSYGFTNPMPESDEGPYMVTAADVCSGYIQYDTCRRTTRDAFDRLLTQKSRPIIGDVLLTKDGTLGRVAVVDRKNICINQSVAVLRPMTARHSQFIATMLSAPRWQAKMLSDAGGSTIKHIYITVIDKMLVAWPKREEELLAISARIENCSAKIECEEGSLKKLRQQKLGLMHDLLTGKVRVKFAAPPRRSWHDTR